MLLRILLFIYYKPKLMNFTGNYGAYNYLQKLQSLFGEFPGILFLILLISGIGKSFQTTDVPAAAPGQKTAFMSSVNVL
ncbi:hypothetical protein Goari_022226 [Gossypium aridum]|uniref:Uncharacterized protein n=1 Tax=Gossypium aridum TaxID=34290 RepID=A0A7J8YSW9_GOSAI|nr:hypothetical protein [Gossypium aridum]